MMVTFPDQEHAALLAQKAAGSLTGDDTLRLDELGELLRAMRRERNYQRARKGHMEHKRIELTCGPVKAFVIFEIAPEYDDYKVEVDALLDDWIESEDLADERRGFAVLPEATSGYLQELRIARAVACGSLSLKEPRKMRLTKLYEQAGKHFPEDLDGL